MHFGCGADTRPSNGLLPHTSDNWILRSFVPAVSVVGTRSGRSSPCDLCPCPCEEGSKNWPCRKAFFELPCTCSCMRPCRDRIAMCPTNSPQIGDMHTTASASPSSAHCSRCPSSRGSPKKVGSSSPAVAGVDMNMAGSSSA